MSDFIEKIIGALQVPIHINGDRAGNRVFLPPNWERLKEDEFREKPPWISSQPSFTKTESLVDYLYSAEAAQLARYFANDMKFEIVAVMDPHEAENPSFERWKATLQFTPSPEWCAWKRVSGTWLEGDEFRLFLENNLEYFTGDFAGAKLLEMSRNLRIKSGTNTEFDYTGSGGDREIKFEHNVNAGGQAGGTTVKFPEQLDAELRVFRNCETFKFKPRLRVVHVKGDLRFSIDLMETEAIEERAFTHEVKTFQNLLAKKYETEDLVTVLYGIN